MSSLTEAWRELFPRRDFPLFALALLRDLEGELHSLRSSARSRGGASRLEGADAALPEIDEPRLRHWVLRRPFPETLEQAIDAVRGLPPAPRDFTALSAAADSSLPEPLQAGNLLRIDRPWELAMLVTSRESGARLWQLELDLDPRALGAFERALRCWSLGQSAAALVAGTAGTEARSPSHWRGRWHLLVSGDASPDWLSAGELEGAAGSTTVEARELRTGERAA